MDSFEIKIIINKDTYPILFELKEEELNNYIQKIFITGYNFLFPKPLNIEDKNFEYKDIINKIELLKNNLNNTELNYKLSNLESSLEKLIGLSSSSAKKGELAENILENIIKERYGDIDYENKSQIPHSGDAWLYFSNNKIVMLESKNYINVVNKDEINKMKYDMVTNHIKWGIFVSFNSNIQGMKEFDFNIFSHNNENYHIIFISNLSSDITRLDLAISLIRKLINMYSDLEKFPWIVNNIKSELDQLNEILEQNYFLRDNFINMEKDIVKSINIFYSKLRDYQFNMDNKIKNIINKITSTMEDSIKINNLSYDNLYLLTNDKKILNILTRITDVFKKKNIIYENNNLIIKGDIFGNIKVKNKKVTIELINFDIILNFNKDKEIHQNLLILEKLNL
jgi:hypothetical protein